MTRLSASQKHVETARSGEYEIGLIHIKAGRADAGYHQDMASQTLLSSDEPGALKLDDSRQGTAAGIVSRTILQTPELRVVLFVFAEGQELTPHSSRRRAAVQILHGACEFMFSGHWHRLEVGSYLHLPPGELHAVRASHGPFSMLLTLGAEPAQPTS